MFERRPLHAELMDGPHFGPKEVAATFRFLVPVNRLFGGIRPALSFFRRESRGWPPQQTYRILDAGCGAGDVAIALARWGRRTGHRLQIDAIDTNPATIAFARRKSRPYPEISLHCQDIFEKTAPPYDYVHASQFIHHFPDEEVPAVLEHLLALARHKLVINDLVRAPLAYIGTWLLTLFTSSVFRHDARLSVRKGFTREELERTLSQGGFDFQLERFFFYRFLLIINQHEDT